MAFQNKFQDMVANDIEAMSNAAFNKAENGNTDDAEFVIINMITAGTQLLMNVASEESRAQNLLAVYSKVFSLVSEYNERQAEKVTTNSSIN